MEMTPQPFSIHVFVLTDAPEPGRVDAAAIKFGLQSVGYIADTVTVRSTEGE